MISKIMLNSFRGVKKNSKECHKTILIVINIYKIEINTNLLKQDRLAEKRIRDLKAYYFQYNAFLQMEYRLKNTLNFYSSLFILLPKWLNLDVNKLENNEIQGYRV